MADLSSKSASKSVKIVGDSEEYNVDVDLKVSGKKAAHVIATLEPTSDGLDSFPYIDGYRMESDRGSNSFNGEEVVWSYTGSGKFISWWSEQQNSNYRYKLFLDGVEVIDVDMRIFKDAGIDRQNAALGQMDLYYEDGDKTMGHHPKYPVKFNSSVEVRMQGTNGSTQLRGYVVAYTVD